MPSDAGIGRIFKHLRAVFSLQILRAPVHSSTALQSSRSVCSSSPGRMMLALTISADFPGTLFLETEMVGKSDSIAAEAAEEGTDPPGKEAMGSSRYPFRFELGDDEEDDPPLLLLLLLLLTGDPNVPFPVPVLRCGVEILYPRGKERERRKQSVNNRESHSSLTFVLSSDRGGGLRQGMPQRAIQKKRMTRVVSKLAKKEKKKGQNETYVVTAQRLQRPKKVVSTLNLTGLRS